MKVLIVGSGGREDALLDVVLRCSKQPSITLFVAPGNGGMHDRAKCISIAVDDKEGIVDFVLKNAIDVVLIGPEYPLTLGLSDELRRHNVSCFGVSGEASLLEASKAFAKRILEKYKIPTARYRELGERDMALDYLKSSKYPIVIKFDGLAAGKGVYICEDYKKAFSAIEDIFVHKKFGLSPSVIIEEYLVGREISAFAFSDGKTVLPLIYAQDYKKIYDADKGTNTGGMGSYTPVSFMSSTKGGVSLKDRIYNTVLKPTIEALLSEGIKYKGILYAGLMISDDGDDDDDIKVLEYNVRFGDPEAQVILPLLRTDFIDIVSAIESEKLDEISLEWDSSCVVCVVLASEGYPLEYEKGFLIEGLDEARQVRGVTIFHAGVRLSSYDKKLYTDGGRVLNVVAIASSLSLAYERAYEAAGKISFSNKYFRKDIALSEVGNK